MLILSDAEEEHLYQLHKACWTKGNFNFDGLRVYETEVDKLKTEGRDTSAHDFTISEYRGAFRLDPQSV